jgi:predicted alpha/beta-fold hydrolase
MNPLVPPPAAATGSGIEPYRPPAWLTNPHAQTIYASCLARAPRVAFSRERWDTPDGDFVDLDWLPASRTAAQAATCSGMPLIVLFHGLEGSSRSHYARTLMQSVGARGWHGVVMHFRGCSGEPNRLARAYHSGDTAEMQWMLARLRAAWRGPLCAVAVSLGANVLLKWLGETGPQARALLAAACAISAPMDLVATGTVLDRGFNRIYGWNFLRTLRRKSLEKLRTYPHVGTAAAIRAARTLRAFDDHVTSRLHGFRDARDYWTRSSSKPWLRHIALPTLVLNARDDPFLPAWALPRPDEVSSAVTLDFPDHGGHVGFVSGRFPGSLDWLPRRVLGFLARRLPRHGGDADDMA